MLDQHFIPITLDPFFHTTTNYHPIIITFRTTINYRSILIQPTLFNFIKFRASPFPLFKFKTEEGEGKNEMERGGILIENRRENRRSIRSSQDPAELVTRKSNRNCREREREKARIADRGGRF